jgi:hypothetical protein
MGTLVIVPLQHSIFKSYWISSVATSVDLDFDLAAGANPVGENLVDGVESP